MRYDNPTWAANPFHWLDTEDILAHSPESAVGAFLRDLLVERPTEYDAFLRALKAAWQNLDRARLRPTSRQQLALDYACEAMRVGVNPSRYVAEQLGINRHSAYKLLQRADASAKMETFSRFFHVYHKNEDVAWQPEEALVRERMAATPHDCAGSGTPKCEGAVRNGKFELCYSCYRTYGLRGDWSPEVARWLEPEVRRIYNERRSEVINALYEDYRAGRLSAGALLRTAPSIEVLEVDELFEVVS